jgi:hypothetical protein
MYTAKVMAKWDASKFTKKEIRDLEKNPVKITDETNVSCPCGRFKGTVKELANNEGELRCPVCGNYNMLRGLLYLRIFNR